MSSHLQSLPGTGSKSEAIAYLKKDIVRNALDIWNLKNGDRRYVLYTWRLGSEVKAHLGLYNTPEAFYVGLGGEEEGAEALMRLIPEKAVLTIPMALRELVERKFRNMKIYPNDFMVVRQGEDKLRDSDAAIRLSTKNAIEYSTFGSSSSVGRMPLEWTRERLRNDFVFGVYNDGVLASVASLVARLPEVAVILGVETKPEFRRRGLGRIVVSAAVQQGLRFSMSCALFVRSDNEAAVELYRDLGFRKAGEELWIDVGTGLVP